MTDLLSPKYRDQLEQAHRDSETFGAGGAQFYHKVALLCMDYPIESILDYGCGKGALGRILREREPGYTVREYDPITRDVEPQPSDLVACTDVLEHIEPDSLDAVLDHIAGLLLRVGFFVITCRKAKKSLPDGRNMHLIIKPPSWWREKLEARWLISEWKVVADKTGAPQVRAVALNPDASMWAGTPETRKHLKSARTA